MGISIQGAALCRVDAFDKQTSWAGLCPSYCTYQEHLESDVPFWGCTKDDSVTSLISPLGSSLPPLQNLKALTDLEGI